MFKLLKEDRERNWFLVEEWTTKAGLPAQIRQCVWKSTGLLHPHYTGYVQVPEDRKVDEEKIDVHGGVTFSLGKLPLSEDKGKWIGFDMAHYGDEYKQDIAYAKGECERMAEQVMA